MHKVIDAIVALKVACKAHGIALHGIVLEEDGRAALSRALAGMYTTVPVEPPASGVCVYGVCVYNTGDVT